MDITAFSKHSTVRYFDRMIAPNNWEETLVFKAIDPNESPLVRTVYRIGLVCLAVFAVVLTFGSACILINRILQVIHDYQDKIGQLIQKQEHSKKMQTAAITIQRICRGFLVRKDVQDKKKNKEIDGLNNVFKSIQDPTLLGKFYIQKGIKDNPSKQVTFDLQHFQTRQILGREIALEKVFTFGKGPGQIDLATYLDNPSNLVMLLKENPLVKVTFQQAVMFVLEQINQTIASSDASSLEDKRFVMLTTSDARIKVLYNMEFTIPEYPGKVSLLQFIIFCLKQEGGIFDAICHTATNRHKNIIIRC